MYLSRASGIHNRFRLVLGCFVLGLMVLGLTAPVQAERATSQEMRQVAENYLLEMVQVKGPWAGETKPSITGTHEILVNDMVVAQYYDIAPRGFVLVPVLKEMAPIKAYSETHNLDDMQEGGFLRLVGEQLAQRMQMYTEAFGSLDARQPDNGAALFGRGQRKIWDDYTLSSEAFKESLATKRAAFRDAGPLTTSSWHQHEPYNDFCPEGDGGRTVVGCVATATAQIIKYWGWPASGIGSTSYTWAGDSSCGDSLPTPQVLSADFSDEYDWANIPDSVDGGWTTEESEALAELNYEVGVAFQMNYGACGSGAYTGDAVRVLPTYFKYSPEAEQINRANYTLEDWYGAVQTEIDAGRVIQYRINLHSIVCDGYRRSGELYQYHMNYGWGNSFNAWYTLDSLYCGWIDGDICPADEEYMIINIFPQTDPVLSVTGTSLSDGNGNGMLEAGETVDMTINVANNGQDAVNTIGSIVSLDSYLSVTTGSCDFPDTLIWGASAASLTATEFSVQPGFTDPHVASLEITISCDGGHSVTDTVQLLLGSTSGFADDAESGPGYWTHAAVTNGFLDEWHLETSRSHSSSTCWKYGGAGFDPYDNSTDGGLVTRPILLPANAQLTFWHWIDAEQGSDPGTAWDGAVVMISDGVEWEQVEPVGGYPYSIIDNTASPFAGGTPAYSGQSGWTQATFDLSAYTGVVQLMFRFGSDGFTTGEGWYVDDIEVASGGTCCTGPSVGNVDGTADNLITMGDLTVLIDHLFITLTPLVCVDEGNVDLSVDGLVTMADLTVMIDHLFITLSPLPACP